MNKKRRLSLILVFCLFLLIAIIAFSFFDKKETITGDVVNEYGVIVDYSFEETLYDNSGNGIDTKGEGIDFNEGVFGKALRFNGYSYVDVPYHPMMNVQDEMSISLWIKKESSAQSNPTLISRRCWFSSGWSLNINEKTNVPVFQVSDGTKYISMPLDTSIKEDKWEHLALVIDKGTFRAYLNGKVVKEDSETLPRRIIPNIKPMVLGKNQENNNNYFVGFIDEVKVFNRAISEKEVQTLFEEGNLNFSSSKYESYRKEKSNSFWEDFKSFFSGS